MNEDNVKNDEDDEKKFKQLILTSQMFIMSELNTVLQNMAMSNPDSTYLRLLAKFSETDKTLFGKMEKYLKSIE